MTTLHRPNVPAETPVEIKPPYANKAIAAGITAVGGFVTQWITTGSINFDQEGVTAIVGAVATALVWFVSNYKRKGL